MNEILKWAFGNSTAEKKPSVPVTVHIYDLGNAFAGINIIGRAVGTGAFHAGVEIYGKEYSFGCGSDGPFGTGIFYCPPRGCTAHVYQEALEMGDANKTKREVNALIEELMHEWHGNDYDLLRRNCCHFSDELCNRLGVGHLPPWVTSLAGVGAVLRSNVRLAVGGAMGLPNLAMNGVAAAVDLFQPAEQDAGITHRRNERAPLENREDPFQCRMPDTGGREVPLTLDDDATDDFSDLRAGDWVEVFSNSRQVWCAAQVKSIDGGQDGSQKMVTVSFRLPGTAPTDIATKTLPLGHRDMRRVSANMAQRVARTLSPRELERRGAASPLASGMATDLQAGDWVEVFSHSHEEWCLGRVTRRSPDYVNIVYQLPGAGPDDVAEKQLPFDSDEFRSIGSALSTDRQLTQAWSAQEEVAYRRHFDMLLSFSTNSAGTVDAEAVKQYIQGAGLPQKVLDGIWTVANRNNSSELGFFEFAACCRLIGHCQAVLTSAEPIAAEVLVMAGAPLSNLLREGFLHVPPPMIPQFWGSKESPR